MKFRDLALMGSQLPKIRMLLQRATAARLQDPESSVSWTNWFCSDVELQFLHEPNCWTAQPETWYRYLRRRIELTRQQEPGRFAQASEFCERIVEAMKLTSTIPEEGPCAVDQSALISDWMEQWDEPLIEQLTMNHVERLSPAFIGVVFQLPARRLQAKIKFLDGAIVRLFNKVRAGGWSQDLSVDYWGE